ncbi:hypothetical protein TSUD_378420 [Trifolium subterraneum]|uniref:Uncharacterized protein n=1 Tax=Trifolium subterraneum TaxID=3900 RepID=A0A2Z6N543_TRISU|nr:hypothetical protein TSUD_378420 [Trifolium subterraneum]
MHPKFQASLWFVYLAVGSGIEISESSLLLVDASRYATVIMAISTAFVVGKFIQLAATFFCGFVVAFVKGLALVLLACLPCVMSMLMAKMSNSWTSYLYRSRKYC